jgi:LysM repeat protein
MKKQIVSFILAGFLLLTFPLSSQNKSFPTQKLNGVEYYMYTVQEGEGLFAIGRKFEISPEDIDKANPEIKNGLKAGQQILIPVKHKTVSSTKPAGKSTPQFIQHRVEKKQTLFAISRKYNVSQEDIRKYNPEIQNGFKDGIVLRIPVVTPVVAKESNLKADEKPVTPKPTAVQPAATKDTPHFITHTVKQNETLFSICKHYNVEMADVIKLNPGSATKIAVGSDLKIPAAAGTSKVKEQKAEMKVVPANAERQSEKPVVSKQVKEIKIGFLLPFMLDQAKKDPKYERFQNFYAGALMAIQQAKEKGISFEVYTYDTENSEEKLTEVLSNPELKTVDLLIGPAFTNHVSMVSNFARENKINTLIPFTAKVSDIDDNPYLFQFNPGSDTELAYLIELLSGKYKGMHVVLASIQGVSPLDDGRMSLEILQKELIKARRDFSEIELSNPNTADFASALNKGEQNLIIFNTDKFVNISPYLALLHTYSANYNITLLEQYSWRNQIENTLKCIYISPFISSLNPESLAEFNQQFQQFYGKDASNESPRYEILGYDLSNYFISLIHRFGSKFGAKISSTAPINCIQSQPLFERSSSNSGFINQRVYLGEDKAQ